MSVVATWTELSVIIREDVIRTSFPVSCISSIIRSAHDRFCFLSECKAVTELRKLTWDKLPEEWRNLCVERTVGKVHLGVEKPVERRTALLNTKDIEDGVGKREVRITRLTPDNINSSAHHTFAYSTLFT